MTNEIQKLIEEHILKKNNLHNQKNGNGYTAIIEGKKVKPSNINDLVDKLFTFVATNESATQWYADINKEMVNEAHNTNKTHKEVWLNNLAVCVNNFLTSKAIERDTHTELSISSAFNGNKIPLGFTPEDDVNDADIEMIKGVVFCETDDLYYFKKDNSYSLLGSIEDLTTKNSKALRKLYNLLADNFTLRTGKEFHFWHEMFEICNNITSDFISSRRQIDELIKQGTKDVKGKIKVLGHDVEIFKVLKIFNTDPMPTDWNNSLCDFYAKYLINTALPATLLNRKMCTLNYETSDPEGCYFKRFALTFPQGGKAPFSDYLLKLFECSDLVIRSIPHIKSIPHIISDDTTPAKYYIDSNWKDKLVPGQYEIKDCKILNTFLHPYTNEEKLALMGWVYTVLHPSYGDTINLLFKTGGGSFKTNYYSSMIQRLLCVMYNVKNNDCSHTMLKDSWVKDRFLLEGINSGLSMAAFVNNDECTIASVEEFKNFSGGGKNGMDYSRRTMRENPTQMKIYSKWLFTTNNNFLINDDSGAYDRRLFIIDRMDVKKLNPPYPKATFENELEKEMLTFYNIAEDCYKQILKTHKSLEDYVTDPNISISKNLKMAYAEDDKVFIYYSLFKNHNHTSETEPLMISIADFNTEVENLCEKNEVNYNGFKNWVKSTDKTTRPKDLKLNKWWNHPKRVGGDVKKYHALWPLKSEFVPDDIWEDDSDINNLAF